jgi:hypothetical protein
MSHVLLANDIKRHCEDDEQGSEGKSCDSAIRDYNRPLRIGLLFVVLFGTGLGTWNLMQAAVRLQLTVVSRLYPDFAGKIYPH